MERDPAKNDRRRSRRERRLGSDAACILCGYSRRVALVSVDRAFLEEHHLLGWVKDDALTACLCRNCHAEVTEDQLTDGFDFRSAERSAEDEAKDLLLASGRFLSRLGPRMTDVAYRLESGTCLPAPVTSAREPRENRAARLRRTKRRCAALYYH